ncbi:hypothetical protein GCM10023258_16420 [Terrabacter aeriphilus]|uniref:Signal peptidase I n=1 Tax=Terrabacter aeriphilus TaxID=515662 RepID=A0ABP9JAP5_9MICO
MLAIGLLGAVLLTSRLVVEPVQVTSESMTPTLRPDDRVLVLRAPFSGDVHRGDVVVVDGTAWERRQPSAAEGPPRASLEGEWLVKRAVALSGDSVALEDGSLVVNGSPVDEPWVDLESVDGTYFGPVTVPQGEVFVLGDDRDRSVDSRTLGPVPLDAVRGRVLTRWWPWG